MLSFRLRLVASALFFRLLHSSICVLFYERTEFPTGTPSQSPSIETLSGENSLQISVNANNCFDTLTDAINICSTYSTLEVIQCYIQLPNKDVYINQPINIFLSDSTNRSIYISGTGSSSAITSNASVESGFNQFISVQSVGSGQNTLTMSSFTVHSFHSKISYSTMSFYGNKQNSFNIHLDNMKFINNTANAGGVIYGAYITNITVTNSYFGNNRAAESNGGAIIVDNSLLFVQNSIFERNSASHAGGAIYLINSGSGSLIRNCKFIANEIRKSTPTSMFGGAVYITQSSQVTVTDCVFDRNSILANTSYLALSVENIGVGGALAIDSQNNEIDILGCTFVGNWAMTSGGAVYVGSSNRVVTLRSNAFYSNSVMSGNGGAVYIFQNNANVAVINNNFKFNSAYSSGGAVYALYLNVPILISDSTFESNVATTGDGGAVVIYDSHDKCRVRNTTVAHNTALLGSGGGIFLLVLNNFFSVIDSKLHHNSARQGGAVFLKYGHMDSFFINSQFHSNIASFRGGAIANDFYCQGLKFAHCNFVNNSAGFLGGALYFGDIVTGVTVSISTFTANKAALGGSLYLSQEVTGFAVSETIFSRNHASQAGGAMYINLLNENISVTTSTFTDNSASQSGGAIAIDKSNKNIFLRDSKLANNSALANFGGALQVGESNSNIRLDNCSLGGNRGRSGGGAINLDYFNSLRVQSSSFRSNTEDSGGSGGGAILLHSSNVFLASNSLFADNKASTSTLSGGGAVSSEDSNDVVIDVCVFRGNVVTGGNGGALFIGPNHHKFTTYKCVFDSNAADRLGGAIHAASSRSSSFMFDRSRFVRNAAATGGGSLSLSGSSAVSITNSTFQYNSATTGDGGAVLAEAVPNLLLSESHVVGNSATSGVGGGLAVTLAYESRVLHSRFVNNSAVFGSACAATSTTSTSLPDPPRLLDVRNCTFTTNSASGGGTVYWTNPASGSGKNLYLSPSVLSSNRWKHNAAKYGDKVATQAVAIQVLGNADNNLKTRSPSAARLSFTNVTSNTFLSPFITEIVDSYSQTVVFTSDVYLSATSLSSSGCGALGYLTGQKVTHVAPNTPATASISSLGATCLPGQRLSFSVAMDSSSSSGLDLPAVSFDIFFRKCHIGEYFEQASGMCIVCGNWSYSVDSNADLSVTRCKSCVGEPGVQSCFGSVLNLQSGHYRVAEGANTVSSCPVEEACLGGPTPGTLSCAVGYTGPLCGICAAGYRVSGFKGECASCSDKDSTVTVVVVIVALILLAGLWKLLDLAAELFHLDMEELLTAIFVGRFTNIDTAADGNRSLANNLQNYGVFYQFGMGLLISAKFVAQLSHHILASTLETKVLFSCFQILTNFPYILRVELAEPFNSFVLFFSWINLSFLQRVGLSCSFAFDHVTLLQTVTLGPIGVCLLLLLAVRIKTWLLVRRGLRRNFNVDRVVSMTETQCIQIFLLMTYLILPGVSVLIFKSFNCVNADPDGVTGVYSQYLVADMSIRCDSQRYYFGVVWATLSIFLYPIGIPTLYGYLLYLSRHKIHEEVLFRAVDDKGYVRSSSMAVTDSTAQLRFLHMAYKPLRWYWEVIETFRRIFMVGVLALLASGTSIQIVIGMVASVLFIWLYAVYEPYNSPALQLFAELCQWSEFLVLFGALAIKTDMFADISSDTRTENIGVAVGMLIAAVLPLVFLLTTLVAKTCRQVWTSFTDRANDDSGEEDQAVAVTDLTLWEQKTVEEAVAQIALQRAGQSSLSQSQLDALVHAAVLRATEDWHGERVADAVKEVNGQRRRNMQTVTMSHLWSFGETAQLAVTKAQLERLVAVIKGQQPPNERPSPGSNQEADDGGGSSDMLEL